MEANTNQGGQLTYEQIMNLFLETREQFKETRDFLDTRIKYYDKKLELDRKALEEKIKENDKKIKMDREALEKRIKENDRYFKMSDKKFRQLETLFTGQWGKLIESLVEGRLVHILNERGIEVERTTTNYRDENKEMEFDIIAINGKEIVVVEVKTTLKNDDVNYFVEKLNKFKSSFHEFEDKTLYGAVAYLKSETNVIKYSEGLGLFVIKATGDSAKIVNKKKFEPKVW
jgi:Holliday junction resolvase